jgi:solute carrier family 25 (mitochondrial carnitine/acylcarnitine transporter), member 20/29
VELVKNCAQTSVLMAADHTKAHDGPKNAGRVSSYNALRQIVRERGVGGLYTGFRLHLVRDVVGSGIFFGVYEALKQSLNSAYGVSEVNAPGAVMFAGAVCGVLAWCVVCWSSTPTVLLG